jgi:hypothetical protein
MASHFPMQYNKLSVTTVKLSITNEAEQQLYAVHRDVFWIK